MSQHISKLFCQAYSSKMNCYNALFRNNYFLATSLPNINCLQYLTIPAAGEKKNIEVPKARLSNYNQPVDDILSSIDVNLSCNTDAVILLKALRMQTIFKKISTDSFKEDSRFKYLCETFQNSCQSLTPSLLVSGLRSLLEVGIPPTDNCVVAAEEMVLKNIDNFTTLNLIGCLYFHHNFSETDLQKAVVTELVKRLQERLYEVSNPSEVLLLMHIVHLFDKDSSKMLENKIAESTRLMTMQEMYKLLCLMGEKSYRSILVLKEASYHLKQRKTQMSLKETVDMFYVFKKLNFFSPSLFVHILNPLESEIPAVIQPSLISGILTVCGQLKFRHTGILDACGEWIKNNLETCRTREFVAYALTTASLNYCTQQVEEILNFLLPHLTLDTLKEPQVTLDVAWSLAVQDCAPKELLLQVLSLKFYKQLVDDNCNLAAINKLKLLNLKGVLKMKYPDCIFGCDLFLEPTRLPETIGTENSRNHVLSVLSNIVPQQRYLSANQVTDTGVFIDAEFIMDKALKPLPIEEYGVLTKPSTNTKQLPKNCKRIALLVKFQKDYTYLDILTGINALGVRLLTDSGYTVVVISYKKFSENKTEVQKAKYLSEKIRGSVLNS